MKIEILRREFRDEMDSHEKTKRNSKRIEGVLSHTKSILAGKDAEINAAQLQVQKIEESKRMEFFKYFEEKQFMGDQIRSLEMAMERQKESEAAMKYQLEKTIAELFLADEDEPDDFVHPEPPKSHAQAVEAPNPTATSHSNASIENNLSSPAKMLVVHKAPSPIKSVATPTHPVASPPKHVSAGRAAGGNTSDQLMAALKRAKQKQQKNVQKLVEHR